MFPSFSSSSPPPPQPPSPRRNNMSAVKKLSTTTIHIMALDGIINVNSLFTLGLFLGLTLYPTTTTTATTTLVSPPCSAGPAVAESLVSCHVYSFSCFLFSSLVASALKQGIRIANGGGEDINGGFGTRFGIGVTLVRVNFMILRFGILFSGFGSVFGCGFLTMALVDLVQIKLGVLSCKSFYTLFAICPLVTLVPLALLIYVCLVIYAFSS
ncbi:hypothetical protein Dsin_020425 [Dipteronia sinensis]|uniref:Maternal effect embryo arrest 60 n=1 Tax=Dipteronia sinensis TaxID=43782 RepID=A0AAE0A9U5_9ROSI|nr:hypothetical protein Dsin_020425 [Dipteronia sinensis]